MNKKTVLTILIALIMCFPLAACGQQNQKPTITFESNGGTAVESVQVNVGECIDKLTNPTREGYTFAGWYLDTDLSIEFNLTIPIGCDLTLYAKWSAELRYSLSADETYYSVSGINKDKNQYKILSEYNGKPVKEIGSNVFANCSNVTSITIPDSVTSIGDRAFYGCSSIESIEIPSSITSIGSYALYNCSSLESIEIPSSVTSIGKWAFYDCNNLTIYCEAESKPSGWDGDWNNSNRPVVWNCKSNNVADDGYAYGIKVNEINYAIKDNTAKVVGANATGDITIPSTITYNSNTYSVTSIGEKVFDGCSSLESIEIPSGVTSIGERAFYDCSSLESVTFGENSKLTSIGEWVFAGCNSLTCIEIPSSVTSIGNYSFVNCSSLESVTFGENSELTSIGTSAFSDCRSLKSIEIPSSVTSIGYQAFSSCTSLVYNVKDGLNYLGNSTNKYYYLVGAESKDIIVATINSNCKLIGDSAFYNCSSIESIEIPSSVTSIGDSAFYGCSSLESVPFGENSKLTSIGNSAFYNCSSLESIEIPSSVTSIGNSAFFYCSSLKSIEIPSSVTSIGNSAFFYCSSLKSIEIPSSVTSIGIYAFNGCRSLESIEIPDCVTGIGSHAFSGCSSLESIEIPSSVTIIESSAFYNCSSLESVTFGENSELTSIGTSAFSDCRSLKSIEIPSSVTSIGYQAFSSCTSLVYNIKDGLNYLGNSTNKYYYLVGAESKDITVATINSNCKFIGYSAFSGCSSLESIEIPSSVTSIGSYAFYNCSSLKSIEIPSSVTSIGDSAFYVCTSLVYNVKDGLNYLGNSTNKYYYLVGAVSKDITVATINSNCKFIREGAFSGCSSLVSIEIPSSVTSIGERAFYWCSGLESIEIPSSVTSIGEYAFEYCSKLTIYCEATSKPSEWSSHWNLNQPVVWGYTSEE